jgi:hypothetical protein
MTPATNQQGLTVSDVFSKQETDVLIEVMRAGGFSTPASAIRCGLYRLAQHLDVECAPDVFAVGRGKRKAS